MKKENNLTTPGLPQISYLSWNFKKYTNQLNPGVNNKSAFTLVELIIVITILAILATIAFISFQWYTKSARDGNRLSTISNIQKWLDVYLVQVWTLPEPDWTISSWSLNSVQLVRMWIIWDNISRLLKLSKTPTDPVWWNNYTYWISADNKYYQIWATLENLESYNNLTKTTYADNWNYRAKVVWNYKYPLKIWSSLYSLPSLLFTWTWWDLSDENNAKFIVDKWENIPYSTNNETLNNKKTIAEVLESITWTWWLTLTWVNISSINVSDIKNWVWQTDNLLTTFWINDKDILWRAMFWSSYNTEVTSEIQNSCASPIPSWVWVATIVEWTPTSINQTWQNTNPLNPCYVTCNSWFWWNWNNCENNWVVLANTWVLTLYWTWWCTNFIIPNPDTACWWYACACNSSTAYGTCNWTWSYYHDNSTWKVWTSLCKYKWYNKYCRPTWIIKSTYRTAYRSINTSANWYNPWWAWNRTFDDIRCTN